MPPVPGVRLLFCAFALALSSRALHAQTPTEDIPVPGGTTAFSRALGIDPVPHRAEFLTEVIRVIYSAPELTTTEALIDKLRTYIDSLEPGVRDGLFTGAESEAVPIPLTSTVWSRVIFKRPIDVSGLFYAVIADPRAALLAHGLAALDDETLQFLAVRPALLARLYERDAALFGVSGESLHIRNGSLLVPGGNAAVALWEAIVGAEVSTPELFIRQLFDRDEGRLAYLFGVAAQIDRPTRAFLLGLWMDDPRERLDRFKALVNALNSLPGWTVRERSFRRPPLDPLLLLTQIATDADGAPRSPGTAFWSRVFDSGDLSPGAVQRTGNFERDSPVDAAWIAQSILRADVDARRDRFEQLMFGLRAFRAASDSGLSEALAAVRALPRYRMLMLTLERMGVARPDVYAAAARHAARLSALGTKEAFVAMSQFQGAIALLVRLRDVHRLTAGQTESLVLSLSAIPLNGKGRYAGGVARWFQTELAPYVAGAREDFDGALISALAGASPDRRAAAPVSWEGSSYQIDLATHETRRVATALQRLGAEPAGRALALEAVASTLASPTVTLGDIQAAVDALGRLPQRDAVAQAVRDLSRIVRSSDLNRAKSVVGSLRDVVDDLLGEAMLALVYALNSGSATTFGRGNLSRRHDFGLAQPASERRVRMPWLEPIEQFQPGVPWHVTGALLGLDLGLSGLTLWRISSDTLPGAPVLSANQGEVFTKTVALLNPFELTDRDRTLISDAIGRGRQRVAGLMSNHGEPAAFDALADEIAMNGWRRRTVRWALARDPDRVPSFFSLADLFYLGDPQPTINLGAWGVAAGAYSGCLCTMFPTPGRSTFLTGRWPSAAVTTQVADLNLRIVIALTELQLPAALARDVLASATQDYIDRVRPLYSDDWLTMVRFAQALPLSRIEDYLGALTASGPLVPYTSADGDQQ